MTGRYHPAVEPDDLFAIPKISIYGKPGSYHGSWTVWVNGGSANVSFAGGVGGSAGGGGGGSSFSAVTAGGGSGGGG